jgi:para-aminobenzoate synthetase component I
VIELELGYRADTLALFERLLPLPRPILLHSADRSSPHARYDVLAADPTAWVSARTRAADGLHEVCIDGQPYVTGDALDAVRGLVRPHGPAAPHFRCGFLGYFGYGLQHRALGVGTPRADPTRLPELQGGLYAWSIVTDHRAATTRLYARDASPSYLHALLQRLSADAPPPAPAFGLRHGPFRCADEAAYRQAFARIQHYLHAGDCYQVNLARHYAAPCTHDGPHAGWGLYRRLLDRQPGAFAAYLDVPGASVLSFSPERLLHYDTQRVETCPIKGTARRASDASVDQRIASELTADPKNRAENLMIVDLLRNDLGRVCVPGSIDVRKLFELISLRNVHHLVSTVVGRPRPDADAIECLRALFPGGSITGAPKLRAMQIIDELEPVGRSVYCGAIGYLDASGTLDLNIAIRTVVVEADRLHCWGGGAIVAESDCDAELQEIDAKIGRLLQTATGAPSSSACSSA